MAEHLEPKKRKSGMQAALVIDRPVVLVGMMGVGKTSIGKRLADRLGTPFVDADDEIEKAAGLSITEIFAKFGEAYFRDGERRVIARLIEGAPKVIATGGGAGRARRRRWQTRPRQRSRELPAGTASKSRPDGLARKSGQYGPETPQQCRP